jgi:uncharacterized cupin superfamily protein
MSAQDAPLALDASAVPPRAKPSSYPEPFLSRMSKREKRALGDVFGLKNFGVNLTRLLPGGESALLHRHSKQDEFIYVLSGFPTLVTDAGEIALQPGMCAGFPASGRAHQLVNRTAFDVVYLEVGDRTAGDEGFYPADDIRPRKILRGGGFTPTRTAGRIRVQHPEGGPSSGSGQWPLMTSPTTFRSLSCRKGLEIRGTSGASSVGNSA